MTSRVEAVAEILWHRYSPDHEGSWPSPNADEYRRVASDILSALTTEPAAPEGRQEAAAKPEAEFNGFVTCVAGDGDPYVMVGFRDLREAQSFHRALLAAIPEMMSPTRPAEQAVTKAMVEAAMMAFQERYDRGVSEEEIRLVLAAALSAA